MSAIQPPTVINSFLEHPVDKTGLQSPLARPRTNENIAEFERARAAAKPADKVEISPEAMQATAKADVVNTVAKPPEVEKAPTTPLQAQAGKTKLPVDFLV
jgi:hypothetical protein